MLKRILAVVIALIGGVLLLWLVMRELAAATSGLHFGRSSEWLRLLIGAAPFITSSIVLGAIIAFLFRRSRRFEVPVTIFASVALSIFCLWLYHNPNEWSWHQPIVSVMYHIAPAVWFFVGPAFLGVGIVHWIYSPAPRGSIWKHLTNR